MLSKYQTILSCQTDLIFQQEKSQQNRLFFHQNEVIHQSRMLVMMNGTLN